MKCVWRSEYIDIVLAILIEYVDAFLTEFGREEFHKTSECTERYVYSFIY